MKMHRHDSMYSGDRWIASQRLWLGDYRMVHSGEWHQGFYLRTVLAGFFEDYFWICNEAWGKSTP